MSELAKTEAAAPPKKTNPFAGIEHLFTGDIEPHRIDFMYLGAPCFVEILPMDSSAENRFQGRALTNLVQLQKLVETGDGAALQGAIDELQLELLENTVSNFQFARKLQDAKGESRVEHTPEGKDLEPAERRKLFEGLTKQGRTALVLACCEVAGLDPLLMDFSGILGSAAASTSSPASTETSAAAAPGA